MNVENINGQAWRQFFKDHQEKVSHQPLLVPGPLHLLSIAYAHKRCAHCFLSDQNQSLDYWCFLFPLILFFVHCVYNILLKSAMISKNHKVVIVDWDDTILPSTFVDRWNIENFRGLPLHVSCLRAHPL